MKQRKGRKERGKKGFLVLFSTRRISVTGVQYYEKVAWFMSKKIKISKIFFSLIWQIVPENFSVFSLIQEMRTQRPSLVQTQVRTTVNGWQYVFVSCCLSATSKICCVYRDETNLLCVFSNSECPSVSCSPFPGQIVFIPHILLSIILFLVYKEIEKKFNEFGLL